MVFDSLRVYHSRGFKVRLLGREDEIQICYLLSYSSGLNPGKYLNCFLKAGGISGKSARDNISIMKNVVSHIKMSQKKLEKLPFVLCARK